MTKGIEMGREECRRKEIWMIMRGLEVARGVDVRELKDGEDI